MTNSIGIDKRVVNRFLYFMAFFEYASRLNDLEIYKRSLKAPEFDDFSKIKRRLSVVMLKALRSERLFEHGKVINGNDHTSLTFESVSRMRAGGNDDSAPIESYMTFKTKYSFSSILQDLIPVNEDQSYNISYISNRQRSGKELLFKNMVPLSDRNFNRDLLDNPDSQNPTCKMYRYLLDNYEIGFSVNGGIRQRLSQVGNSLSRSINTAILENGDQTVRVNGIHIRQNTGQYCREHISDGWGLGNLPINFSKALKKYALRERIRMDEISRAPDTRYINYANVYCDNFFTREVLNNENYLNLPDNIIFGMTNLLDYTDRQRTREREAINEVTMFLTKRNADNEVVPNVVNMSGEMSIYYNPEVILDPDRFIRKNEMIVDAMSGVLLGDNE